RARPARIDPRGDSVSDVRTRARVCENETLTIGAIESETLGDEPHGEIPAALRRAFKLPALLETLLRVLQSLVDEAMPNRDGAIGREPRRRVRHRVRH